MSHIHILKTAPVAHAMQDYRRGNRRRASYLLSEEDEALIAELPKIYSDMLRQVGSMEEVAARLGLPVGTVKSRTHRARAALDILRKEARGSAPQAQS